MHLKCPSSDTWRGWEHFQRMINTKVPSKAELGAERRLGER